MFILIVIENGSVVSVIFGCVLLIIIFEVVWYVNFLLKLIFLGVLIFVILILYDNFKDLFGNKIFLVCVLCVVVIFWFVNVILFVFWS